MAVEGVNNNNSQSGLYAAGAAAVGAGAGAVTGYMTKSILKDGKYTDEFVKSVAKVQEKSPKGKAIIQMLSVDPKSSKFAEEIWDVISSNAETIGFPKEDIAEIRKIKPKEMTPLQEAYIKRFYDTSMVVLKNNIENISGKELKLGKDTNIREVIKEMIPSDLDEVFDRSKKAFKSGKEVAENEMFSFAKKAQRNLKLKAAGIYGAIGAGVLGLGTYLCCAGKKQTTPVEKPLDEQA